MLLCSLLTSFHFCWYEALFGSFRYLRTTAFDLTWLNIVPSVVVDPKPVKNLTYSRVSCSNLKKIQHVQHKKCLTYNQAKMFSKFGI